MVGGVRKNALFVIVVHVISFHFQRVDIFGGAETTSIGIDNLTAI